MKHKFHQHCAIPYILLCLGRWELLFTFPASGLQTFDLMVKATNTSSVICIKPRLGAINYNSNSISIVKWRSKQLFCIVQSVQIKQTQGLQGIMDKPLAEHVLNYKWHLPCE